MALLLLLIFQAACKTNAVTNAEVKLTKAEPLSDIEHSYMARIIKDRRSSCSGVFIRNDLVLTAAHCVFDVFVASVLRSKTEEVLATEIPGFSEESILILDLISPVRFRGKKISGPLQVNLFDARGKKTVIDAYRVEKYGPRRWAVAMSMQQRVTFTVTKIEIIKRTTADEMQVFSVGATEIHVHPKYEPKKGVSPFDLALIKTLPNKYRKVLAVDYTPMKPGDLVVLMGYGKSGVSSDQDTYSATGSILRRGYNQVTSSDHYIRLIGAANAISAIQQSAAVNGDSGGPLLRRENNTVVGIFSGLTLKNKHEGKITCEFDDPDCLVHSFYVPLSQPDTVQFVRGFE